MSVIPVSGARLIILLFAMVAWASQATAAADESARSVFAYEAHRDSEREVDEARQRAIANDTLLLLVFGAEWCHDSVGFAQKLSEPTLLSEVRQRFEIVFVDLGFYSRARDLFRSFGMPTYFGTPTVLVVDPIRNQILNEDSLAKWQSADSVPAEDYLAYFTQEFSAPVGLDAKAMAALAAVRTWEAEQAQRLQAGFDLLGPMLAMEADGQAPRELDALWVEVRGFRVQLQRDLVDLRRRARTGTPIDAAYDWPAYPAFSWER